MKKILIFLLLTALMPLSAFVSTAYSAGETNADYTSTPTFVGSAVPPLVMMLMGRDHKLYYEAYNDASDIDEDGQLDIGYKHSIDYYGYFDSHKCYNYVSTGTAKFVPVSTNTDKFCAAGSGYWSGNFLNWMTTSRIDALRKVLYGGYRSTDSSAETVLESEYKPQDAHSWGKELTGTDTNKLTPFTDPSGSGTLPTTAVTWGTAGTSQKILLVTYDDNVSGLFGNNHTDLVNSYSVCSYNSYNYIGDFNYTGINPAINHIDTGNFFLVTEFQVTASNNGTWSFAVDGDDGVEVEIWDKNLNTNTVVASYYGAHGPSCGTVPGCLTTPAGHIAGTINLTTGWHRMIVRHREATGGDGVKVWYKVPGDTTWRVFGSITGTGLSYYINFRAPNIINSGTGIAEVVRLKTTSFITTGEPAYDASGTGTVTCSAGRHLFCMTSLSDGATPVIRVLQNQSNRIWDWASKERPVCDTSLGVPTDYFIRVKACDSTVGLESNCKAYPNSPPSKPTGLFQKFGESTNKVCSNTFLSCNVDADCSGSPVKCIDGGSMFFGLMSGSYTKNLSGGVVRWNLDSITHAVDNRNVGIIKTASDNLIKTLNNLTVKGFSYTAGYYYNDNCGWITGTSLTEGQCRMWGNPIGEMMYEAERYFAGKGAPLSAYSLGTNAVGTDDRVLGLTNAGENPTTDNNWIDPYLKYPSCSKPFMIVLSDVSPSYDSDQLPGVDTNFGSYTTTSADLTNINVKTLTDTIGAGEGINGANAFIGQVGASTDSICSSKAVTTLGSVRGLCPEEPTKKGSYYSAGVAYYGKKNGSDGFSTNNGNRPNVTTYSVALISPVPEIKVVANGKTVTIVPIGKSVSGCLGVNAACAAKATLSYNSAQKGLTITPNNSSMFCPSNQIVDFYIETLTSAHGNFRVNFEDVEQGADHDMDSIVQYTYDVSGDNITIGLNSSYAAGCIDQILGFVITGTTEDGVYLPVRDRDSGTTDADTSATVATMPTTWTRTFTASAAAPAATLLKNPLWYAAKWGGFEDQDGDNKPYTDSTCGTATPNAKCSEWDKDGDGVPDTYFLISNPLKMEQQLTQVFADILKKSASGTSVSILATSAEGEGALYQAYFYPERIMKDGTKRNWLGYCRGLFLDSYGNLREDSNSDAALIFANDKILRMRLDTTDNSVKADLYNDANEDGIIDTAVGSPANTVGIDDAASLWEAGEKLAKKDKSTRNIYTWIDINNDGLVDNGDFSSLAGEALSLDSTNNTALKPYLGASSAVEATNIINFTRGNVVTGYRNRCAPIKVTGSLTRETGCSGASEEAGTVERVWPLGDIVYSTPTTVATPKEQYDQIYGITSYTEFRKLYKNRRNVVYVGANDGMLHAFNGGVYTAGDNASTTTVTEHGQFAANPTTGNGWSLNPERGEELWAFTPYDNLPHLKWLTSTDYKHVYYADLKPKATDVRIFCDTTNTDTTPNCISGQNAVSHPGGWGTIIIVGMRFGGGLINVAGDFDNNALTPDTTRPFRSAYYVLDVTDPEQKPRLLWRFTNANLGLTTSYPGIAHIKVSATSEKWFIIIGSGPDNLAPPSSRGYDGSSTQQGRVFVVNLLNGSLSFTFTNLGINNAGLALDANTFMGDPTVMDGDLDYTSDVIYIGSVIGTTAGKVYRINTNQDANPANWALSTLINQGKPLLVGPSVSKDSRNNFWVFFGTGRFWATADKTNSEQQTMYGIKDACWKTNTTGTPCPASANPYLQSALLNTSTLSVCTAAAGGGIYDSSSGTCGSGTLAYSSYTDLLTAARAASGWYLNLTNPTTPSERVIARSVVLGGLLAFTTFTPNSDICAMLGDSNVYALYYETGTAYIKPVIGYSGTTILRSKSLGKGMPTTIGVAVGKKVTGYVQTSTGAIVEIEAETPIPPKSGAAGWREKTGGGGTVDIEEIYKHIVK